MMKLKTWICSLSFLILCIGVQIDVHFAGSEFYSISLFGEAESCCEGPCDCCHNEGLIIKYEADYIISAQQIINLQYLTYDFIQYPVFEVKWFDQCQIKAKYEFPDSPPLIVKNQIPILLQQFRC